MFKNNSFAKDSNAQLLGRLDIMKNGIVKYKDSIGPNDAELAEISAFVDEFDHVEGDANIESAKREILSYSLYILSINHFIYFESCGSGLFP